ncbi:hypothetical protein LEP1GSC064_0898 [Leptospira kirschneri serovar Grippotyphosa str. Moskva]|nr:hypothetical protein LEP1GSC064_0898 [Leptospira kirschneri serovar Grippotyphosa str. Moskva]EMK12615.1 hypothetical protein LEP1GSC042_0598 [Leptospira kirschneri serovar Bim str. PUO 1247]EMN04687.1 hypothetical protein LEP1GSC046_1608 [Leptospira kirschneri serovar Bim str. 1051]
MFKRNYLNGENVFHAKIQTKNLFYYNYRIKYANFYLSIKYFILCYSIISET